MRGFVAAAGDDELVVDAGNARCERIEALGRATDAHGEPVVDRRCQHCVRAVQREPDAGLGRLHRGNRREVGPRERVLLRERCECVSAVGRELDDVGLIHVPKRTGCVGGRCVHVLGRTECRRAANRVGGHVSGIARACSAWREEVFGVHAIPTWQKAVAASVVTVVLVIVGLMVAPTGKVAFSPAEPTDLQGRIKVAGTQPEPIQGRLSVVDVRQRPVRLLRKLWLQLRDDDVDFVAEDGGAGDAGAADGGPARDVAAGVAFDLAGVEADWGGGGVTLQNVEPGMPAQKADVRPGDVIISVDGMDVDNAVDARRLLLDAPPGRRVRLVVRRSGNDLTKEVETVAPRPGELTKSSIGAALDTLGLRVELPRSVRMDVGSVGAAGGLGYAIFVYDAVAAEDLLQGRSVVATGQVTPSGEVRHVDRIRQRAIATQRAGADLFLVPDTDVKDALAGVRSACPASVRCVRVIPVRSVAQAVDALRNPPLLAQLEAGARKV